MTDVAQTSKKEVERVRAHAAGDYCALKAEHTPSPAGYIHWHTWAAKMVKTHNQKRCKGCGLYKIWVPKTKRKVKSDGK